MTDPARHDPKTFSRETHGPVLVPRHCDSQRLWAGSAALLPGAGARGVLQPLPHTVARLRRALLFDVATNPMRPNLSDRNPASKAGLDSCGITA